MFDFEHHSHVSISLFFPPPTSPQPRNAVPSLHDHNHLNSFTVNLAIQDNAQANIPSSDEIASWSSVKKLVDKVHKHVCVHATFSDIRTLLVRNLLWSDQVQRYLVRVVSQFASCKASATPAPNRCMSIASLSRQLNDFVCIDHFHLDGVTLFDAIDTASRYFAAHILNFTCLHESLVAFEFCWLSQFWPPTAVHVGGSFTKEAFLGMLQT